MKKLKIKIVFILFILSFFILHSVQAQDSSHIRISLLTCAPGSDQLYETFGHSALRVTDRDLTDTDIVFNYGTFNFDDAGFYLKFIRGKLLYYVSVEDFQDFELNYQQDNRAITEQLLNFSSEEKIKIVNALILNSTEQNRYYKYDFFFDNCTTRLRDIIENSKHPHPIIKPVMPPGTTFRQAIYQYLDKGKEYWSKLGIDLLLGAKTDAVMTTAQSQFLPENLMVSLDSANINHQLVISKANLFSTTPNNNDNSLFTPGILFSSILIVIILLSFSKNNFIQKFLLGFDGLLFFFTGLLGIIMILMWTATDHVLCANNFNLLWAWPMHSVMAFYIHSKKRWAKKYYLITAVFLSIVLLAWFFLPQQMNNSLIPIILLLIYRSTNNYLKA
jgi:hypothetical protein